MSRGKFCTVAAMVILLVGLAVPALAGVAHPMNKTTEYSNYTDHVACEMCGMDRNAWARTRYIFTDSRRTHYVCSIHCVAAMSRKSGEPAREVRVALYLHPEKMIEAAKAVYVIGSSAPGTMTATSKLAFADRDEAEDFIERFGGKIAGYDDAFAMALAELGEESGGMPMHGKGHEGMKMMNHDMEKNHHEMSH